MCARLNRFTTYARVKCTLWLQNVQDNFPNLKQSANFAIDNAMSSDISDRILRRQESDLNDDRRPVNFFAPRAQQAHQNNCAYTMSARARQANRTGAFSADYGRLNIVSIVADTSRLG